MLESARVRYNQQFSQEKYQAFLHAVGTAFGEAPTFRISETPVFVPAYLREQLIRGVEDIVQNLVQPDFKARSAAAIPAHLKVPNEDEHTVFLQLDFGICDGPDGRLIPQLIEMQGFPSLYFFQAHAGQRRQKAF